MLKYIDKNVKKCLSEQHEYIIMHKLSGEYEYTNRINIWFTVFR